MAQLVKIEQCVSRYQTDFMRYANRFIWLKKRREAEWLLRKTRSEAERNGARLFTEPAAAEKRDPDFYSWLYAMQLDWASSTSDSFSALPQNMQRQDWLKDCLQQVNDLVFFFYQPILVTQSAEVQLNSLILTNDTVWCLTPLHGESYSVFQEENGRRWREIINGGSRTHLNPLIALQRTRRIMSAFLSAHQLDMKVKMVVLAPDSFIEFVPDQFDLELIDRRRKKDWYQQLSRQSLLFKRCQTDAAEQLLEHVKTDASARTDGF